MKTDELIAVLAANAPPIGPAAASRRFLGMLGGAALLVLGVTILLLGVRGDMAAAAELPMFWFKLAFPASIAAAALLGLRRLAHPGVRLGHLPAGIASLLVLVWAMSAAGLLLAPPSERPALLFGSSWGSCMLKIALLALPALWLALVALRAMAPTRPALSGAAAGLFAGACAAFAYAFYCTEMQLSFVGVWYAAGMLIPAVLGSALGKRFLRW